MSAAPCNRGAGAGAASVLVLVTLSGAARADGAGGEVVETLRAEEIIVVTGTRSETPREAAAITTEVIDRQRLVESGAQTAADALSLRPGLWLDRGVNGRQGLTMQGLGPQYSLILVDGARQIGRTDGLLDLDRFAIEDLEQIEIVRGPSSVLYGSDALGGVVNLVTRAPREGLAVDALGRLDGRLGYEARARIAGGTARTTGALTGTLRDAPAISLGGDGRAIATTFDAYRDAHVTGRAVHEHAEAWRFDATADYLRRDLHGVDASATGAVFDRRNVVETAAGRLAARWMNEATMLRVEGAASMYRDQFLSDQRMADALDQYTLTDEALLEGRVQVARHLGRHRLLAGAELLHERLASDRLAMPGDRTRAAVFAQDEWRVDEQGELVVVPAARLDADTQFGTHATPRLAARWQLREAIVLRGSIGLGYRAPSFKELLLVFANPGAGYAVAGNPELDPETSTSVQVGSEWRVASWLWLAGDAYVNRLRDMIFVVTTPDDGSGIQRYSYDNIGRARTAGGEAYAIATHGRAGLELGYAFTHTRDLDSRRALEGVPAHRVTATLRWRDEVDRFDAFAAAVLTGHRPYFISDDPQRATLTARRIELRARIAKRFANGLGGFVGVDNLLDAGDAELDRLTPRTVYAGVEAHL